MDASCIVAGDHIIDVSVRDCSVCDSPFVCKVFDNNQIFVSNVPTQAVLSQPVTFGSQCLILSLL